MTTNDDLDFLFKSPLPVDDGTKVMEVKKEPVDYNRLAHMIDDLCPVLLDVRDSSSRNLSDALITKMVDLTSLLDDILCDVDEDVVRLERRLYE